VITGVRPRFVLRSRVAAPPHVTDSHSVAPSVHADGNRG